MGGGPGPPPVVVFLRRRKERVELRESSVHPLRRDCAGLAGYWMMLVMPSMM